MSVSGSQTAQRLPSYLPAIYRDDQFLGQYLWAFEQVLLDLEQRVGDLARLFDPIDTPPEFLPWLSSWVAFTLRADLSLPLQRKFIGRIVSLYSRRGTKQNLEELLSIFTRGVPTIVESGDTGPAHHFHITLQLSAAQPDELRRQLAIAHALIDLEKPAHTDYDAEFLFPTMQIGVTSHVGVDTLLGTQGGVARGGATLVAAPKSNLAQQHPESTLSRQRPKSRQERPKSEPKQERPKSKPKQEHPKSKAKQERPKSKAKQERPKSGAKQERPKSKPKQARPKSR